ncbi:MAG: TIGR00282 family metallophosphoesterase [Spartobacteria bacterium]|nr:TIGR00282 family metallophosphoesterase [Spartobacteria bacterium]
MKILIAGDIVGSPGRTVFAHTAVRLRQQGKVDFVIANAENAAGGRGLLPKLAEELFAAGADVLTLGDHAWDQRDLIPYFSQNDRVLRPGNFPPGCPGRGWVTLRHNELNITVINLVGRVFMAPTDCPFRAADEILKMIPPGPNVIIVDIHAEATSEKIALGRYLDGRVTAVVGSHTHVPTADEGMLPRGTAYITDIGMSGPKDSIIGRELEPVLKKFITGMPQRFEIAKDQVILEGVILDVDSKTGRAKSIKRIREQAG